MQRLRGAGPLPTAGGGRRQKPPRRIIVMAEQHDKIDRRGFIGDGARVMGALGLTGAVAFLAGRKGLTADRVWQIDAEKCMACSNCQTYCVLDVSAVKAVQCYALCGRCDECTGYFCTKEPQYDKDRLETGAENHLCPTGAIERVFLERQGEDGAVRYFEYNIDEEKCIACGKCVLGCREMNGSFYLQVRHDRCLNCNECAIAVACPTQAFSRVPASAPNILSQAAQRAVEALRQKREQSSAAKVQKP
jgi:Na+-translocating ferredoxin:NAD+ oxidoreductase subunit B